MYRLITRHTIEEKIMGLQKFKLKTANTVITSDNASLQSMATDKLLDLFSLEGKATGTEDTDEPGGSQKRSIRTVLQEMPELWDESLYEKEYDVTSFSNENAVCKGSRV